MTHLDQRVAQGRRCDVTDPHTGERRHAHQDQEHHAGSGPCSIENSRCGHDVESGFGQYRRDGEPSNQKHDSWGEHLREDIPERCEHLLGSTTLHSLCCVGCGETDIIGVLRSQNAEEYYQEGYSQGSDEQRDCLYLLSNRHNIPHCDTHLCGPENGTEDQHR